MDASKLVRMANQIGMFFRHEGEEKAALSIKKHLKEFWDPRMRNEILVHLDSGGAGLDASSLKAVQMLKADVVVG
jgi:formate dehydrogenase subunit delta